MREKITGIYKITNLINGKIYIGQSIDIYDRWWHHKWGALYKTELSYNSPLHRAFRKYGLENFAFEIIEECGVDELDEKECLWIKKLNSLVPNGYNVLIGGQKNRNKKIKVCQICGGKVSSDTRVRICWKCYSNKRIASIPDKNVLYQTLIENQGNFVLVGKIFNVTENAVRRWCRKYGLSPHKNDYKSMN